MLACNAEWNEKICAYLDSESSKAEVREVEAHIDTCPGCSAALDAYSELSYRIRQNEELRRDASPEAASRIEADLLAARAALSEAKGLGRVESSDRSQRSSPDNTSPDRASSDRAPSKSPDRSSPATPQALTQLPSSSSSSSRPRHRSFRRRAALSLVALAAALAVVFGALFASGSDFDSVLMFEVEGQHMRAFTHGKPCEFESADPQAVSDWIASQSEQRLQVPELPGASLLGARRCELKGKPAMALVYQVDGRGLTIFVPGENSDAASSAIAFSEGGARCTTGSLGERICAASGAQRSAVAVGADESLVLFASTAVLNGDG